MARNPYLPASDADRVIWLNNFAAKFAPVAVPLGFVAADVTAVTNDAVMFAYLIGRVLLHPWSEHDRLLLPV